VKVGQELVRDPRETVPEVLHVAQKVSKPRLVPKWQRRLKLSAVATSGEIPEPVHIYKADLVDHEHLAETVLARLSFPCNKPDSIAGEPLDGFHGEDSERITIAAPVPELLNIVILNEVFQRVNLNRFGRPLPAPGSGWSRSG
jgi:hypothetical protein